MESEITNRYSTLAKLYQDKSDKAKFNLRLISWCRLALFLFLIPLVIYLVPASQLIGWLAVLACITSFLLLVKQSVNAERKMFYYQNLALININEIKAISHDFSPFNPGNEYIHPEHDYSYDLDLFGENSFFQFLNRTVTSGGKNSLATSIQKSDLDPNMIRQKQLAVNELSESLDWRQQFLASGYKAENIVSDDFIKHQQVGQLKHISFLKFVLIALPAVTIALGILWIFDFIPSQLFYIAIFIQWILFLIFSKTIGLFKKAYGLKTKLLNQYVDMLELIEKKEFNADYLLHLKNKLFNRGKAASQITSYLQKILNELEYSQNILVGFLLDSILLWDIRCIYQLNKWHNHYEGYIKEWFEVIAEMDALISMANLNYNHPDWAMPVIKDSGQYLHAENLGHPLILKDKRIGNRFSFNDDEKIVIITGANMAGKSTFLRTLGINLILASQGSKVCASSFTFTPVRLFTHMRTSDNLMQDESYFYAELLRLQHMLELLRNGDKLFIIIDEMLKGTNSIDKLNGSIELLKQLIHHSLHCVVATHDLKLTELALDFPGIIKNQCFEVNLTDDELIFDYQLKDGVTSTMNATFLMRKMGIIP